MQTTLPWSTPRARSAARRSLLVSFAIAACGLAGLAPAQPPGPPSHTFKVVTVAEGLRNPWSMAFLPNGDMLVTERPGQLRIIRGGKLLPDPVPGVPPVR